MATEIRWIWTPAGGANSIKQDLNYKKDIDSEFNIAMAGLGPAVNTFTITGSFEENRIYQGRITNYCAGGGTFYSPIFEAIKFLCPATTQQANPTLSSLAVVIPHVPSSITQYIVKLYDASGTSVVDSKTINGGTLDNAGNIIVSFPNLQAGTTYKARVELYAGVHSKLDCPFLNVITSNTPACSAPVITSAVVS
jgi:hypothetical protein